MDIVRDGEKEATNYFFSVPGSDNVLELTLNHDGRSYEMGTGYGHIAIGVDDLDGTLGNLKGQGIEPERPPYTVSEGGSRLCFVRDPDYYRVEMIERAEPRASGSLHSGLLDHLVWQHSAGAEDLDSEDSTLGVDVDVELPRPIGVGGPHHVGFRGTHRCLAGHAAADLQTGRRRRPHPRRIGSRSGLSFIGWSFPLHDLHPLAARPGRSGDPPQ